MSTEPHKLTYKKASAITEYIFAHPGKSKIEILNRLVYTIVYGDWEQTENLLTDCGIVHRRFVEANPKKGIGWYYGYFPDKETSIKSAKKYLRELFKRMQMSEKE